MEVVALNEQLREEFAGVVKHFLTIRRDEIARVAAVAVVSASQTDVAADLFTTSKRSADHEPQPEPSSETTTSAAALSPAAPLPLPGALLPERTRQYATLAKTILRKVNTYQYTSREQFGHDIAELLLLTDANDQKLLLRQLVDQQYALQATAKPLSTKRQKVNGIRIDSATIAGIQCGMQGQWACNVDMGGNTSTTSRWNSREKAEAIGYKAEVRDALRESPESAKAIVKVTRELAAACAKFDSDVLRDAMKQVKQRLPISKHHDVSSLTAALTPHVATPHSTVNQATTPIVGKEKDVKSSRKRELLVDTAVPVAAAIPASQGKPITPAAATPELVAKRTPTDNHSRVTFLRLRRLIQIRLCRHLEGREICARLNGNDPGHGESWRPTGRLERGKVFSYSTKKFVSFSDFVLASLKRSVAACEHLYLLDTRENIDAHLLVCDQFSDDFRQRLDENFKEVSEQYKQGKLL